MVGPLSGFSRRALCLMFVAMCAVSLGACKKSGTEGQTSKKQEVEFVAGSNAKVFTFALSADPQTLDPAKRSGSPEGRIAFNLFEGLLMPGPTTEGLAKPEDLVVPGVAKSFDI